MGATAGLRLLPGGKADHILAAVKEHLTGYPFKLDNVSIIDGARRQRGTETRFPRWFHTFS